MNLKRKINKLFREQDLLVLEGFIKIEAEGCPIIYELIGDKYNINITVGNEDNLILEIKVGNHYFTIYEHKYREYMSKFKHNMRVLYNIIRECKNGSN